MKYEPVFNKERNLWTIMKHMCDGTKVELQGSYPDLSHAFTLAELLNAAHDEREERCGGCNCCKR